LKSKHSKGNLFARYQKDHIMHRNLFAGALLLLACTNALPVIATGKPLPQSAASACDLNSDGSVNGADVQLAINQSIGVSSCSTADLDGSGQCNVVDVQRIVNAALGKSCRVGPGVGTGTVLYVAPTGSDATNCTLASPCRQITKPLTLVHPGDTILVADGSYNAFTVDSVNGTSTNPITIKARVRTRTSCR
jgi:hypothetical protein